MRAAKYNVKEASRMSAAPFRCRLVVMVKAPVGGRSKTRLARDVGLGRATGFARSTARAVLLRLARDPRWETLIAITPDAARAAPLWPRGLTCIGQGHGDLGERMLGLLARMPPGPVVLIGSDIPGIRRDHIAHAFRLLGAHSAVFGPAADGGYWLVGLKRRLPVPNPFKRVRWSSAATLADTLANLDGLKIGFTAHLDDVDDGEALTRVSQIVGRVVVC